MRIPEDRRPTLASWPKRIFEWDELQPPFHPALSQWRALGMPPGNVTYIPRIHQYSGAPEYAVAWFCQQVCIQRLQEGTLNVWNILPGQVTQLYYQIQLLKCTVTLCLSDGQIITFSYNKTKEEQIYPVISLLLGQPGDYVPPVQHPGSPAMEALREESYAMHHTALLTYRFGHAISHQLFLRGKNRSLLYLLQRRPDPECFCALTDAGPVLILNDYYGTRALYLPAGYPSSFQVKPVPHSKDHGLYLRTLAEEEFLYFRLLPGQEAQASAFAARWPSHL